MKKFLALTLVAIMLLCLALPTFAESKISAKELEAYGQLHWYLGTPTSGANSPNVEDGIISEDEYSLNVEVDLDDPHSSFDVENVNSAGGYITSSDWTWHMDHDENYIYVAMSKIDPDYTPYETSDELVNERFYDTFVMNIGSPIGDTTYEAISRLRFMTALGADGEVNMTVGLLEFNKVGTLVANQILDADDYVPSYGGSYDADTKKITVEFSIDRGAYEDFWNCDLDVDPLLMIAMFLNYGPRVEGSALNVDQGQVRHSFDYMNFDPEGDIAFEFTIDHDDAIFFKWLGPNVVHLYDRGEHEHAFDDEWSKNATHHYHECECGEKADSSEHSFDDGAITKNPTTTQKGEKRFTCTVCGYESIEDIDKLPSEPAPAKTTPATTDVPKDENENKDEGGCGSAMALAALAIVPALAVAFTAKKKED